MRRLLLTLALLLSAAVARADYESTIAAESPPPCHWWKLQDTSGTAAVDAAGDGCTAINNAWTGSPALAQPQSGVTGATSVALDGSTQWAKIQKVGGCDFSPSTSAGDKLHMSWEWWGRITNGTQATQTPFGSDEVSGKGGWAGYMGGSTIIAAYFLIGANDNAFGNTYREVDSSTLFAANVWQHVIVTWDGSVSSGTLKLYLNGVLESNVTSGAGTCCGCAEWITFGALLANTTPTNRLTGNLQYMALYGGGGSGHGATSATLTATQALAHYNAGITPPGSPSQLAWPFMARRPALPQFRQSDYLAQFVARGYNTGHLSEREVQPRLLNVGWLPFAVVPWGNVGH